MQIKSIDELIQIFDQSRKERIVLVGKAASGKDYARSILEDRGFPYQISYTTRPMRIGETHGKDYYFIPEYKFKDLISIDFFYEYVVFNSWYYGTSRAQMGVKSSIFIMTPSGIAHMTHDDRLESLIVYFDMPEDVRKERLSLRSDADTVDRRLEADRLDFTGFLDYGVIINDSNFK